MKYVIKFGNETYPISEEEMPKVVQAMERKSIVVLKCGVINGAFIRGIVRDIHGERDWNYGYIPTGADGITRKSYITEIPKSIAELLSQKENKKLN